MGYSIYFSDDLFITIVLLVFLAGGIGLTAWGSYMHSQAFSSPPGKSRRVDWQGWHQLLTWRVISPGYNDPAVLEEFSRSRVFIHSSAAIGGGLAIALAVVMGAAISLAATGTLISLTVGNGMILTAVFLFAFVTGFSLGYVYGVWELRRITARKVAYGDLQQRRLSDYRSVLFPCIAGAFIACTILMPLIFVPSLGVQIPLSLIGGSFIEVPGWVLEAIAFAMVLALVTGEVVMARIARLPRLLLISNPQTAQRADNLLRATTISTLQGLELLVIGYLGMAQWSMVVYYFGQSGLWQRSLRPYGSFLDLISFLPFAVVLIGILMPILAGRIGGKISRWPWQPVRNP